jgi:heme iron utilization protein
MVKKEKVFYQIKTLLDTQHFAVLATQGSEYPYCTLVGYAITEDCKEIIFATIRDTHKYKNLKEIPSVSMLIDSQTNQVNDFKQAQALTILGTAQEIEVNSKQDYLGIYLKKHPNLEEFVTAATCALIKVRVMKYILVNDFQNVFEYTFD